MDLLSRLLVLVPVSGQLEVRCHFGTPWRLAPPAAGRLEIPYHVLLRGEAVVEGGQAPAATLRAGDVVLFPGGGAHALHDGSGSTPQPVREQPSATVTVARNAGAGPQADILCGRFVLSASSERLVQTFLPGRLIVSSQAQAGEDSDTGTRSRLARLIALLREEAHEEGPGSAALVGHLSAALFALTLRLAATGRPSETPGGAGERQRSLLALAHWPRLQPAVLALFDAPEQPWTLPRLAALCHLSRATLVRQFAEATGHSPIDLLTEIRMAHARRRLGETQQSVAAIGEAVGYLSEAAFQRAFKRQTGLTPARARAMQVRPVAQ